MKLRGKSVIYSIGSEGSATVVALSTDCVLDESAESIKTSPASADDAGYVCNRPGKIAWSIKGTHFCNDSNWWDVEYHFKNKTRLYVEFDLANTDTPMSGYGHITKLSTKAPVKGLASFTLTITGDGKMNN